MENFKYNIGTYKIRDNKTGLIFMIKSWFEEELLNVTIRLTHLLTSKSIRKKEFVSLLERINKLQDSLIADTKADMEKKKTERKPTESSSFSSVKSSLQEGFDDVYSISYFTGRISTLRTLINFLIEAIADSEEQDELSEKDKQIIEESKKVTDLSYLG